MKRKTVVRLSSWILCVFMTLFIFAGAAYAKGEGSKPITMDDLEIIATEMEADGVYNTGGFGGLLTMRYNETVEAYEPSTACALINRKGESIFPYTETGYQYYVYGDYISLAYKDAFTLSAIGQKSPKYYRISGDKIEELATNLYTGTPMINGYAVGYDKREDMWQGGNAHMADAKNQTVYSYPEAFNTLIGYGGGPSLSAFYSENSIACISDGVIGCFVRGDYGSLQSSFLMDFQGNKIIDLPGVTSISSFSEGLAFVRKGLYGFIDTKGQLVIDYQYSLAGDFCDGMAYVRDTTGKFGYINQSGEVVIPLEYDDAKGAGNGLAAVAKEKKYGLVNYQNEVVVPLEYDDISSFVDGVAYAVKDGKVYIIRMKEEPAPKLFDDVQNPNAWYYETVYEIANTLNANGKPLMSGYGNGNKFGPADPLTRQDFAVILYRLADEPEVEPMQNPFKDTKENGYYYTCVVWAKANEVIAGYNDGRFGVGDKITREQVATILYRFAKDYLHVNTNEALGKGDLKKFEDGTAISSWAKEALTWATGAGVITGKANGTKIDARGNAARAEIGAMILRFKTYIESAPVVSDVFVWNGQKEVWAILPTTAVPGLLVHADTMGYLMEKEGWTYKTKDAQGKPSKEVDFVNDAIAAGNVGALMIAAMDVDAMEDVCAQAREAGIAVNMLGVAPEYPVAGYIATAYELTGEYAVRAAQDWVAKRVAEGGNVPKNAAGKYEVAIDYYVDTLDGIYRSNAVFGTIKESDNLVAVSATQSYGESTETTAYKNTQTVLAGRPDCRIFVCYEADSAVGIAEAIADYAAQKNLDLADFCVIPCYSGDNTFMFMYADAALNHSANAIKGYSTFGGSREGPDNDAFHAVAKYANDMTYSVTGEGLATILLGVCGSQNYSWTYNTAYYDETSAVNVYGFELNWKQGDVNTAEKYRVDQFLY